MEKSLLAATGDVLGNGIGVLFVVGLYFLPSIISNYRKHPNNGSIVAVNLFLGWTLVFWVISLAMALSSKPKETITLSKEEYEELKKKS